MMLRRFDDRLLSTFSSDLAWTNSISVPDPLSSITTRPLESSIFTWSTPEILELVVSAASFVEDYGKALAIEPSFLYCAVATSRGHIVCFDYAQNVQCLLGLTNHKVPVTALAFSPDSLIVCAGYLDGSIHMWDLKKIDPISNRDWALALAPPIFQMSPEHSGDPDQLASVLPVVAPDQAASSIKSIAFMAGHNDMFLSLDSHGRVMFHHVAKNIFAKYHTHHQLAKDILAVATLPLGPEPNFTDRLGVFAYISSNVISIGSCLSLNDSTAYYRRIHFSEPINDLPEKVALDWCPQPAGQTTPGPMKLAFSTDNIVLIILLSSHFLSHVENLVDAATDKDKASPPLIFEKSASWVAPHSIIAMKWLNHRLLCVFMETEIINLYLNLDSRLLEPVSRENMAYGIILPPFLGCPRQIKRWQNRLFTLTNSPHLVVRIAARHTWSSILDTVTDSLDRARLTAWLYSTPNLGLAVLLGLPPSLTERQKALGSALSSAVIDAVSVISDNRHDISDLSTTLDLYFDAVAKLSNQLMDLATENVLMRINNDKLFFARLQPFILTGRINKVPPIVLQRLVKHYAENNRDLLIRFLCMLDISLLDIDLTINLCEKYDMVDCSIYIYNTLFHDFETPLNDLFRRSSSSMPPSSDTGIEDITNAAHDPMLIFTYLAYTLTGRQYPNDEPISSPHDMLAANTAMRFLLNTDTSDSLLYPKVMLLVHCNSLAFFVMLNEFFECSFLNETHQRTYSRQYIIDALIDAFEYHAEELNERAHTLFAVFVARNYAKYPQFIRLSESQLDSVSFRLCAPTTTTDLHEDCELALISLLAHYSPADPRHLLAALHEAHHHRVLLAFYRSRSQYSQVLAVWIEQVRAAPLSTKNDTLNNVLGHLWDLSADATERTHLNSLVKSNFAMLAEHDAPNLALLVEKHAPNLHSRALVLTNVEVKKQYLSTVFNACTKIDERNLPLLSTYLRTLCDDSVDPYQLVLEWAASLAKEQALYEEARSILGDKSHSARSLAQLLLARRLYDEALDVIVGRLAELCASLLSHESISECLAHAIDICIAKDSTECGANGDSSDDIGPASVGELMWLKLTLALVLAANVPHSDHERTRFLNECVGNCFRSMTDNKLNRRARGGDARQASFVRIFNRFLDTNMRGKGSEHIANLANISEVLQHVFLSYSSETELLQVSVQMLNREIHRRISLVQAQNLQGWSVCNRYCAKCLKAIWGVAPVLYRHFEAWQERQRLRVFHANECDAKDQDDYSDCAVVHFKCSHSYHAKCMSILQDTPLHSLTCMVCET